VATASETGENTAKIALTTSASASSITVGDRVSALNVYLDDAADGTFGFATDAANQVTLPNSQWIEVWRREDVEQNTGAKVIYFAAATGTPDLYYRTTV
jgi:hypothetical protein